VDHGALRLIRPARAGRPEYRQLSSAVRRRFLSHALAKIGRLFLVQFGEREKLSGALVIGRPARQ
jgi:hypothetical protein